MFAPKRTGKDRDVIGKVAEWLSSDYWKAGVAANVHDWSQQLLGPEAAVDPKRLDLSLLYADVDSRAGWVTADGTLDAEIRTLPEGSQTWRLPVTLKLAFLPGQAAVAENPTVEWMWIDGRAIAPPRPEVAAE